MKHLFKFCLPDSISSMYYCLRYQNLHVSLHSNYPNHRQSKEFPLLQEEIESNNTLSENEDNRSLFHTIKLLVETGNHTLEKELSEASLSVGTPLVYTKMKGRRVSSPLVCRSVSESTQIQNAGKTTGETLKSGKNPSRYSELEDISSVVHKITEIIRAKDTTIPLEERLERSGFTFYSEVVEKVLKRCFKVRHLALRFFNWVKLQPGFSHTTGNYNTMIYIAGEAKEFSLVKKLLEDMEAESCSRDIKTWTILVMHYGKAKLITEALLVFGKMRKSGFEPDEAAYKLMIRSLCNVGKAEIAKEFYKEMVLKNMGVELSLYNMLLKCLSESGDLEAVRLVGDDMIKIAQIPEHQVYSSIMSAFCVSGKVDEALGLTREFKQKKLSLDPAIFEILVKGLCRNDRVSDALEIVNIMKQISVVNGKIYGLIVNGYLRTDDGSKALDMLTSMKELGYSPTVSTYTEIIQYLFKSNNYQKAREIYKEMLENGINPDVVAMTAMVAGHVRHNHISEAWEAFHSMKKKGIRPTWKAYSIFIKELCKACEPGEAFKLLNEMSNFNINPGYKTFQLVTSLFKKKGDMERVAEVKKMLMTFKLYDREASLGDISTLSETPYTGTPAAVEISNCSISERLDSKQIEPLYLLEPLKRGYNKHDLQLVCRILSSSKEWDCVQESLDQISIQFTPELVVAILRSFQQNGQFALQFFKWLKNQSGYGHTADTYNMAIKIAGSAKDFKHMRTLYYEMIRKRLSVTTNTWTIMIAQYGRASLTEIALKTFKEMKRGGYKPDGSSYKYLLIFLCGRKGRKVDEAIELFQEMLGMGLLPDRELVDIYLCSLCEAGKLSDARKCVESLCNRGFSIQVSYSLLTKALSRAGRLEEALALENEIEILGCRLDQYIYGSLVHGLLRQRRVDEALRKVDTMKQAGELPSVHIYTSLMVHFLKEKRIGEALKILEEMKQGGLEPTVVTYSALIRGYLNEGMISDAWSIYHRMKVKGPFPDFRTYSMFIDCLCRIGRSEEGIQLLNEMCESGILPSCINFRTVYYGLNREGKQDLAQTVLQKKWTLARQRKFLV